MNEIVLGYCGVDYQSGLVLQIAAQGDAWFAGTLKMRTMGDVWFPLPAGLSTEAVTNFVDELNKLNETLEGKANLWFGDDDDCLTYTVANRGRGILAIEGVWVALVDPPSDNGSFDLPEVRCTFNGFVCEQSYLPDIIAQLNELVRGC